MRMKPETAPDLSGFAFAEPLQNFGFRKLAFRVRVRLRLNLASETPPPHRAGARARPMRVFGRMAAF